jgi:hypothetical protein
MAAADDTVSWRPKTGGATSTHQRETGHRRKRPTKGCCRRLDGEGGCGRGGLGGGARRGRPGSGLSARRDALGYVWGEGEVSKQGDGGSEGGGARCYCGVFGSGGTARESLGLACPQDRERVREAVDRREEEDRDSALGWN